MGVMFDVTLIILCVMELYCALWELCSVLFGLYCALWSYIVHYRSYVRCYLGYIVHYGVILCTIRVMFGVIWVILCVMELYCAL